MSRREKRPYGKIRQGTPLIPPRLRPGDTIGIAAPASPFDTEPFYLGVGLLEAAGFKVLVPKNLFLRNGYLAGTDSQRAGLFMEMFTDPVVKAVFCARGGFGSMRILPLLDYACIRAKARRSSSASSNVVPPLLAALCSAAVVSVALFRGHR
ncbi:MAG: LD-carboxypeptidase [Deltaproteobacteria bacterium]|nr:LD-carboxypeptidase [Deltaproteobacteria bacterium]